jgi:hypothetical protein
MRRIVLGLATVFVCGTLFSAATGFAAWQVWQLNALLYQSAVPGALGPFAAAPPSASPALGDDGCNLPDDGEEASSALAALPYTPELASPPTEVKTGEHKQVVFIAVEADGAPIEVGVDEGE